MFYRPPCFTFLLVGMEKVHHYIRHSNCSSSTIALHIYVVPLQFAEMFAVKLCDIYIIIIMYTFLALLLFIMHNGTTCLYIPFFLCTEITLQNLHLSCWSTHTCHLLQGLLVNTNIVTQ